MGLRLGGEGGDGEEGGDGGGDGGEHDGHLGRKICLRDAGKRVGLGGEDRLRNGWEGEDWDE